MQHGAYRISGEYLCRQFQELQKDKDMLFFSTKRQAAPSQSSQGTAAGSAERPLSYWEEQSGNSHNPGTAGVGQGSGVGHSPLTQAVQSAHTGDSSEGRGGLEEDDSGPALDHAEFRQPSSSSECSPKKRFHWKVSRYSMFSSCLLQYEML